MFPLNHQSQSQRQPDQRIAYSYSTDQNDAYFQRERYSHVHDVLERTILLAGAFISSMLVARFILSLLAAEQTNGIVSFVNMMTAPLLAPFYGLFNVESVSIGSFVFEGYTLLALLGYGVLTALLARAVSITRY